MRQVSLLGARDFCQSFSGKAFVKFDKEHKVVLGALSDLGWLRLAETVSTLRQTG